MTNPFGAERDEALGRMLREHYTAGDHEAFVDSVLALTRGQPASAFEVLAGWIRPWVAVAALLTLVVLGWSLSRNQAADLVRLDEVVRPGDAPASLFASESLDQDGVLAVALGEP